MGWTVGTPTRTWTDWRTGEGRSTGRLEPGKAPHEEKAMLLPRQLREVVLTRKTEIRGACKIDRTLEVLDGDFDHKLLVAGT